jgi:predicted small metal-binding protein
METCPGSFTAATEAELWKHIELHARLAHDENPDAWSPDDKAQVKAAVRAVP